MKMRLYRNRNGVLIKVVQVGQTIRVVAQNRGEIARWDGHGQHGMVTGDMALTRYSTRDEWNVSVKIAAALLRGE